MGRKPTMEGVVRTWLAIAVLALVGCAHSPADIRKLGAMREQAFSKDYRAAAECAIGGYDELSQHLKYTMRMYEHSKYAEVHGSTGLLMMITEFRPTSTGSIARVYVSDGLFMREQAADDFAGVLRRCALY